MLLAEYYRVMAGVSRCPGKEETGEEYDPAVPGAEQYNMYGDRFGKSLCYAWSVSPAYLLARYFVKLTVTDAAKGTYELHPYLDYFDSLECTLPVEDKDVHIVWDGKDLRVEELSKGIVENPIFMDDRSGF